MRLLFAFSGDSECYQDVSTIDPLGWALAHPWGSALLNLRFERGEPLSQLEELFLEFFALLTGYMSRMVDVVC